MSETSVAIIGQRSMVGSVLRERMLEETDFDFVTATYFSTSQAGEIGPDGQELQDAYSLGTLNDFDVVLTTQGSEYTGAVHSRLRDGGWGGYWIDAASGLRMVESSIPILDPVNRHVIDQGLEAGKRDLIGVNCTVSTMLMGLTALFREGLIEWVSDMTYQAASGAGARHMIELLAQMNRLGLAVQAMALDPAAGILEIDRRTHQELISSDFPVEYWEVPLAANIIPWIDKPAEGGRTKEEWKATAETNNTLGFFDEARIAVDGTCVRVGAMRSHAHGLHIKLKRDVSLANIEDMISSAHQWVKFVPNEEEATKLQLTSVSASGDLQIHVGRLRKMAMGSDHLNAFVVGDQLLWGAAEPLRRALRIIIDRAFEQQ